VISFATCCATTIVWRSQEFDRLNSFEERYPMSATLRWGLLGAARVNRSIIPRLQTLPRHELVAIASRDPARAAAYANEWNIPHAVDSYEELLSRDDIDVVYVPLPNSLHASWTIRAIEAGKHVLCEKPLATSVEAVDRVIAAADRARVKVAEAFMYRYHPQSALVRRIVARGDIGEPRLIRGTFSYTQASPGDIRWNNGLDGGALWDVGCYPVSFARMVMRHEPVEVFAMTETHPNGVDAGCVGCLRFERDVLAIFDCSFRSPYRATVEIVGSDAVLQVPVPFKPGSREKLVLVRGDTTVSIDVPGEPAYQGQLEDMARQVLDGAPPTLPLEDSRANVETLVALHRSARERKPVAFAEAVA
jgi:predicted dehydrogenase